MSKRAQLKFANFREVDEQASIKFKDFEKAMRDPEHLLPDGKKLTLKDALAMWEAPLFIPKVINNSIQEAVEPMLIATKLLQRMPYNGPGAHVDMPLVFGALDGDFEIGELESRPELRVTFAGGSQIAKMGKYGLSVKFTDEVLKYSSFDVVSMVLRQATKALVRNKEEKAFNMWYHLAKVTHDNLSPSNSAFGTTTGRDLSGALNGTITMDDVFEMYAQVLAHGWTPNMILVHPLTWLMFVQDAQLRVFAQMARSPFFGSQWTGNPAVQDFPGSFGGEGYSGGQYRTWPSAPIGNNSDGAALPNTPADFSQNLTSAPVLPNYFGLPMTVVVSPFVPYNASTNTTSILMADSNELGFYFEEMALSTSEWTDPETDILKINLTEKYMIRPKNRGLGLAIAKNVVVDSNKIVLPAQATINMAGSIQPTTRDVAVP